MYTEYAFEDKKYEVASKYIKSILFDIVNAETSKLADIREKIAEAEESELRNKMIELCNKHESALLNILGVSDQLNNILQSIDSFSRDLRLLENESLAEIVSNYVEQQTSLARKQADINNGDPVTDAEEVQNTVENNVVNQENNAEEQNLVNSENNAEEQNLDDQKNNAEEQNVVNQQNEIHEQVDLGQQNGTEEHENERQEDISVSEPEPGNNDNQIVNNIDHENIKSSEDLNPSNEQDVEKNDVSDDSPVIESSTPVFSVEEESNEQKDEEAITDIFGIDNKQEPPIEENAIVDSVIDVSQEQSTSDEKNEDNNDINVQENIVPVIEDNSQEETNNISEDEITDSKSQIEDIKAIDDSSQEEKDINTENENPQNDIVPLISDVSTNNNDVSEENYDDIDVVSFVKTDNNQPKAILTSASQISKLRESRITNESLLTAKQFFKFNKDNNDSVTVSDIVPVFPEQEMNEDGNLLSSKSDDSSSTVSFSTDISKEEQMEKMMQQIKELYNSGKVDEAQALSDKVSELNKELQQNQKVLVA